MSSGPTIPWCALDDERITILRTQDDVQKGQLRGLQRDYKVITFQAQEIELEAQTEELTSPCYVAEADNNRFEKLSNGLKTRCTALADETAEIKALHKQIRSLPGSGLKN